MTRRTAPLRGAVPRDAEAVRLPLRSPRAPRLRAQPLAVERAVAIDDEGHLRPRADDAHVAGEHVQELRQLVEAEAPEPPADPRDPRVAGRAGGLGVAREVDVHRAELEHPEG